MSTYSPQTPPVRPTPWHKRKWVGIAALFVGGMMIGGGVASASGPEPVEVVKEVPGPERTVTKTVEKPVEVTPASCLTALDLSEEGFTLAAEAMGYMSDALTAAGNLDVAGIQQANADLEVVSPKMKELTAPMKEAAAECRASAK